MQVRYTLYRDRPLHERQAKFHQGCIEGHVEVVRLLNTTYNKLFLLQPNVLQRTVERVEREKRERREREREREALKAQF